MQKPGISLKACLASFLLILAGLPAFSQMITGTWKGKINRQKVEVKIIQQGDSLTGTSYYYESPGNYRRYAIAGYFDAGSNEAVWWDDKLIEEKSTRFSISSPGKIPMLSRADFNCPGNNRMMLDGKAARRDDDTHIKGEVHMDKTNRPVFEDEWDFVIDNFTTGTNDPDLIDSVKKIAYQVPPEKAEERKPQRELKPVTQPVPVAKTVKKTSVEQPAPQKVKEPVAIIPPLPELPTIEEKFVSRTKKFIKELPLTGDSIELRFYDNAEIDGDSISLFLNDKLLFQHIRLTANPYTFKLAVKELNDTNELIMVAENLGTIPPNTSYMIAIINEQRYDAYLASTEGESAMIRFVKSK